MSWEIKAGCMGKRKFSNRVETELSEGLTHLFFSGKGRGNPHPLVFPRHPYQP